MWDLSRPQIEPESSAWQGRLPLGKPLKIFFFFTLRSDSFAVLGLSCTMWDLVPWPGIEPEPSALVVQSLSHCTTREVQGPALQHGWQGPSCSGPAFSLHQPLCPPTSSHMEHIYLLTHTGVFRPPSLPSASCARLGQVVESSGCGLSSNGIIIPVLPPPWGWPWVCDLASLGLCFLIGLMRKLNTSFWGTVDDLMTFCR